MKTPNKPETVNAGASSGATEARQCFPVHDEFPDLVAEEKVLRDAETANIPFMEALTGALRRCTSLVWPAKRHSVRLALHPASATKNGTSAISASLTRLDRA